MIETNNKRKFNYSASVISDTKGDFSFLVPYGTESKNNITKAISNYTIKADRALEVSVTSKNVEQGETLALTDSV